MNSPDHVLVVDDDAEIRNLLREYLEKNGLRVTLAADGRQMWRALDHASPDIVVLDLMLPGDDGLTLCRNLRARSSLPVIMLTARGEETDRIIGLEMGADDYLAKPFNPRELLARLKSVLRRTRALPENLQPEEVRRVHFGGWTLEVATRLLTASAGRTVTLSGTEYRLLRVFLAHPGRTLNRDQLIDLMLSRDAAPFDRSIDMQVSRLRYRLEDHAKAASIIKTVRGEGYALSVPVENER